MNNSIDIYDIKADHFSILSNSFIREVTENIGTHTENKTFNNQPNQWYKSKVFS
jgi:hypothetical protein